MRASTIATVFGIVAVVTAVGMLFFSGTGKTGEPKTPAEHGKRLFRLQGCSTCHAIAGGLSRGPDLAGAINRLRVKLDTTAYLLQVERVKQNDPETYNQYAADYAVILSAQGDERIRRWFTTHLQNPRFDNLESLMPSFRHLTPQQVDQLTAFLFTLQ